MSKNYFNEHTLPTKAITSASELKSYEETLEEYALIHLPKSEIASALRVSPLLLEEYANIYYDCDFETLLQSFVSRSNALILSKQFKVALEDENSKMLQFLGKNYLQQVDDGAKAVVTLNSERVIFQESETKTLQDEVVDGN